MANRMTGYFDISYISNNYILFCLFELLLYDAGRLED